VVTVARLPYLPADLAEPKDLVAAVRARRGGALLHLDRMLLHSPALARGWNAFLGEVRGGLALDARLRELAVCAVALLNDAPYELHHHAPALLAAGGTREELDALERTGGACWDEPLFDARAQATLRLTAEMTRAVAVSDASLAEVRALLGDRETVELVGVIAAYNMVSRFLVALGVEPEPPAVAP
jgi:AhpD family alkylhydroperoxidase